MTPSRQRVLIIGLIVLGILTVGFFGLRAIHAFREFRRHGPPPPFGAAESQKVETDVELIRDWMTIPYISMTYHVHPRDLFRALDIDPKGNDEKSLKQLNDEFFPDRSNYVLETVKTTILIKQPPTPPATP
ncbi:MAG: hypothetical protein IPP66_22130 [Anaerolineales bacterium]|nr:hypothetical protein [Anaerolineales bacterium]